jgi:hypothetical protein
MAGLALYGDVAEAVLSNSPVRLSHRLESVKVLPPRPAANPPELFGAVTATAASLAEIEMPNRRRVFSMAITSGWETAPESSGAKQETPFGQPTSWSAAIDALAAGVAVVPTSDGLIFLDDEEDSAHRLFVVSAGNVDIWETDHLTRSDLEPVEDPAQSWNALTVGAYTDRDDLRAQPDYEGWTPVAERGELAPFSRTSVLFSAAWPIKPDVVLEGGNLALSPAATEFDTPEVLQVLTTKAPISDQRLLTVTNATSAATSQAAYLAARISAQYPGLWPEAVRALIVHSAEWTDAMHARFAGAEQRREKATLQRRYGMGVPDLLRATRSAADALTLVAQDVIHPFDGDGRMREMHLHELPWPTDVLTELGGAQVRMRVTLSYFVEPNPGNRGWRRRYSYSSHGLRFDVRRSTESTDEFRKRINERARVEDKHFVPAESDSAEWFFGADQRSRGSLHTDIWVGTAADLAQRGVVGVYPVTGWWKQRKDRDHSERGARYALVISIETPEQEVDLWTPVAQEVGIPISIDI